MVGEVRVDAGDGACDWKVVGRTALDGVVAEEGPGEIGEIEEIGDGA